MAHISTHYIATTVVAEPSIINAATSLLCVKPMYMAIGMNMATKPINFITLQVIIGFIFWLKLWNLNAAPIAMSPSGVASTPKKETVLSKITGVGNF